ncbi:MAG: hypothetical protein CVT98_05145 [Bacteroidetes bacterium HGW-Bacteroidetes-15]|nr:MAG: hypothetical protein CVT98_05145 [Bacteroidetes bacterium HGW-Bacteroidetes-15]
METKSNNTTSKWLTRSLAAFLLTLALFASSPSFAHCDSYDGPVVVDAIKALETNNVNLVLKWISQDQEADIISLFNKTYNLRKGDKEIYTIVEKYFLESLVRLHRETEGAPYTGLKPAGTTKKIVQMSDSAIESGSADDLVGKLNKHIEKVLSEKYQKVLELNKVKNTSTDKGREFVEAYVDYTHTIEAIHDVIDHSGGGHSAHKH